MSNYVNTKWLLMQNNKKLLIFTGPWKRRRHHTFQNLLTLGQTGLSGSFIKIILSTQKSHEGVSGRLY